MRGEDGKITKPMLRRKWQFVWALLLLRKLLRVGPLSTEDMQISGKSELLSLGRVLHSGHIHPTLAVTLGQVRLHALYRNATFLLSKVEASMLAGDASRHVRTTCRPVVHGWSWSRSY